MPRHINKGIDWPIFRRALVILVAMAPSSSPNVVLWETSQLAENIDGVPPLPTSGPSLTPKVLSDGFVTVKNGNLYLQDQLWNFASFNAPHLLQDVTLFEVGLT